MHIEKYYHREQLYYDNLSAGFKVIPATNRMGTSIYLSCPGPARGLVVFAHGAGNDLLFPQRCLFRDLLADNLDIYTFNLAGHGFLDQSRLDETTLFAHAAEHLDQAAQLNHSSLPLSLIGYSMGGLALLGAASMRPTQKIEKFSLIGVPAMIPSLSLSHLWELSAILQTETWRHIAAYRGWSAVPALSFIRRRTFPIRFASANLDQPYMNQLTDLWPKWVAAIDFANLEHIKTIHSYWGARDHIAKLDDALNWNHLGLSLKMERLTRATHFSILFDRRLAKSLL